MFILKRQDVELGSFQHPSKEQKIPILSYQGQTFRLLSVFNAAQEEEARTLWRDLTDNRGKACVLLEEPERFSVWGKIQFDQTSGETPKSDSAAVGGVSAVFIKAGVLVLQAMYDDVADLMGDKQAKRFEGDLAAVGAQMRLPELSSAELVTGVLKLDPFSGALPPWQTSHINTIFKELHRIGKNYFGRSNFTERALEALDELSPTERDAFLNWLKQLSSGQLWQ
ncbi:MAG: Npun_F0813 family protein [Cyanobacteria bacterium P01_D01_bin.156]